MQNIQLKGKSIMLKIAIEATNKTGKTSLAQALSMQHRIPFIASENYNGEKNIQYFFDRLDRRIALENKEPNFITDSSVVHDLTEFAFYNRNVSKSKFYEFARKVFLYLENSYDLIVVLQHDAENLISSTKNYAGDNLFQAALVGYLCNFVNKLKIKFLGSVSLSERVAEFNNFMSLKLEDYKNLIVVKQEIIK